MLTHLSIRNFAIVDQLDLDLEHGMTVVSGETGAGKSIMLDALGLALGDRADSASVGQTGERAEILASFDLSHCPQALQWLGERDLAQEQECILRRVITREGRSRGYINGTASPLADLRELGEMLIDIHNQHEHQSLLKRETHQRLLDRWADCDELSAQLRQIWQQWQRQRQQYERLSNASEEESARAQLLSYQLNELNLLDPQPGEYEELESEYRQQSNAGQCVQSCQHVVQLCAESDSGNALQQLNSSLQLLQEIAANHPQLQEGVDLLTSARIQIEEACGTLNHYLDHFEADPERLFELEERINSFNSIARKHRTTPLELISLSEQISEELAQLQCSDEQLEQLEREVQALHQHYQTQAQKLRQAREKAAPKLARAVSEQIRQLGMPQGSFSVQLTPLEEGNASGLESVEFMVTTNPGQPARPLRQVASGGELSRISLAIQVINAQTSTIPTLVFDEVDVGIGGGIAEVVGLRLRQLGEAGGQVICVTHQPQVASQGHQHLQVQKQAQRNHTHTRIEALQGEGRVEEVARMLGGVKMTDQTLAHAREMLERAGS
ncbi:DNA repair protein RecN [Aestuariirhabdus litorea]|uniref:DNA repair protein RecN n=1 Tax=Aestuariirhabdus litorea TaxID=2528527 RepID=A0A3P3VLX6_9GAMM|nr:DNA repair protein RecN [Aestuariirhabdus litorea]RRJ83337.1 DNA repair protein RecN [Aestuariirhabdus litorea]RWW93496.1 DNA repair protein RecN [Endozoicomonadaceae bacterium GTF-13]